MMQTQMDHAPPSTNGDKDLTTTAYSTTDEKATTAQNETINAVRKQVNRKLDVRFVVWAFLGLFGMHLDRTNLRMYIIIIDIELEKRSLFSYFISQRLCQWDERRPESSICSIQLGVYQ